MFCLLHGVAEQLRALVGGPDHQGTDEDHRSREDLAHADLVEVEPQLAVRLAYEFHQEAEQAVKQQEHAGDGAARRVLAPEQVEDDEQYHPFQCELVELGGVARLGARLREDDGPGHIGDPTPQLAVEEVADAADAEAKRNERCHEIGHGKEVALGLVGKPDHGGDDPDQAAVERHATGPDLEQVERIGQEHVEVVEQHVTDPTTQDHPEEAVKQQVGHLVAGPAAVRRIGATPRQPHGKGEAKQVHETIPAYR